MSPCGYSSQSQLAFGDIVFVEYVTTWILTKPACVCWQCLESASPHGDSHWADVIPAEGCEPRCMAGVMPADRPAGSLSAFHLCLLLHLHQSPWPGELCMTSWDGQMGKTARSRLYSIPGRVKQVTCKIDTFRYLVGWGARVGHRLIYSVLGYWNIDWAIVPLAQNHFTCCVQLTGLDRMAELTRA